MDSEVISAWQDFLRQESSVDNWAEWVHFLPQEFLIMVEKSTIDLEEALQVSEENMRLILEDGTVQRVCSIWAHIEALANEDEPKITMRKLDFLDFVFREQIKFLDMSTDTLLGEPNKKVSRTLYILRRRVANANKAMSACA